MMEKESVVDQSIRHLKAIRDLSVDQIKRYEKYPDFRDDVQKMREAVKKSDQIIARAEAMRKSK